VVLTKLVDVGFSSYPFGNKVGGSSTGNPKKPTVTELVDVKSDSASGTAQNKNNYSKQL
jgi:hypothetical protein